MRTPRLAADILIADAKSQPESLSPEALGGVLIVGSASSPFGDRVRSGPTTAEKFVDASATRSGTFFFGTLADASTNTLWTCQLTAGAGGDAGAAPHGAPELRPHHRRAEDPLEPARRQQHCNDFAVGPDKALYISDTANSRIYKLPAGASTAELFLEHRALYGIVRHHLSENGTLL